MMPLTQPLTHTLRLPDDAQIDALRVLDAARESINAALVALWPHLEKFAVKSGLAWMQVTALLPQPHDRGNRLWRCEAEIVGRILRVHAQRKQAFETIRPILSDALILPPNGNRPARKHRKMLIEQVKAIRVQAVDDPERLMVLINVAEQACNFFLSHGCFPTRYVDMQPIPMLQAGMLSFAADDGMQHGGVYRLHFDLPNRLAFLRLRMPDAAGMWRLNKCEITIPLPDATMDLLAVGTPMAPTLRAIAQSDGSQVAVLDLIVEHPVPQPPVWEQAQRVLAFDWGVHTLLTLVVLDTKGQQVSRPFFLDTGGFDGKQARLRRQIDQLKSNRDGLLPDHYDRARLDREIARCWAAYRRRNQALAHLAANILLTFAALYGCAIIAGEWLASLRTTGRGKGRRGRWRNWRNTTTIRNKIWELLCYKAKLRGIRLRQEFPRGTSHTCPRCGSTAPTCRSPEHPASVEWGRWLRCICGWNGARDYAAALNIGRLTLAYLKRRRSHPTRYHRNPRVIDPDLKPVSYIGTGAALSFPPPSNRPQGNTYVTGWPCAVSLHPFHVRVPKTRACVDSRRC